MSRFFRFQYIDKRIREIGKCSTQNVMDEFECSYSSIKKDFADMKNLVGAPIIYSAKILAYHYVEDFDFFSHKNQKLFIFHSMLKSLIENSPFIPIDTSKLLESIEEEMNPEFIDLSDKIDFIFSEFDEIKSHIFDSLVAALKTNNLLRISYLDKLNSYKEWFVEPAKLFNYQSKWYLVAFCQKREELRIFSLNRMKDIYLEKLKFTPRYELNEIDEFLNSGFGIAKCDNKEEAVIRFTGKYIYKIKDYIWHEAQKTEILEDEKTGEEYLQFTLPISKYDELIGRVLRYSPDAEIISPKNLRDKWIKKIKENFEKYV